MLPTLKTMTQCSKDSVIDMRERLRRLKQDERTKYKCHDYAKESLTCLLDCEPDEQAALELRLNRVLALREKILHRLCDLAGRMGINTSIMSTAVFIFDRYISRFTPSYVRGMADVPHQFGIIGVASLSIAAKSELSRRKVVSIKRFLGKSSKSTEIINVELKILVELDWNIIYPSPISIIQELSTLLLLLCGYQIFKISILHEVSHLTKLAAVTYGFVTKFPPSVIALAALMVALENQRLSTDKASFNLIKQFTIEFEEHELGFSFGDEGVIQCRKEMIRLFQNCPRSDITAKRQCRSPTNVTALFNAASHSAPH